MEQVKMIRELEPEEKSMVFRMIDTFWHLDPLITYNDPEYLQ
jgi:hypothetical protein